MNETGLLVPQITPLINSNEDPIAPASVLLPQQYSDVRVTHPLNDERTASVTLSMFDPVVASLQPFQKALRILYYQPGANGYEVVFWGPTNVLEDYGNATVTLEAQDPSVRMQHHYARIGDDLLNDPSDPMKGTITPDYNGITNLIRAALVSNGPSLGCWISNWWGSSAHPTKKMGIERGQEIWAMILQVAEAEIGPDFDMWPAPGLDWGLYATLETHNEMSFDRSGTVQFRYGYAEDNVTALTVTPGHPTTMAHVIDNEQDWRATAQAPAQIAETGYWIDWVTVDQTVTGENTDVLQEVGKARVRAFARPPKQVEVTLRRDTGQDFYYGYQYAYNSDTEGDFYVGDLVQVQAQRGSRSFNSKFRIMQVDLSQPGPRGPVETKLTVAPRPAPATVTVGVVVNTDYDVPPS